jgi:hypothetical protein
MAPPTAHFSHDDRTGVDTQPHGKLDAILGFHAAIQRPHGLHNPQSSAHGAVRIIFVCLGVAKVNQKPITEILRYMAVKSLNHVSGRFLVRAHDLAKVFGIEPGRQVGRAEQIAKHHSQLTAFRV